VELALGQGKADGVFRIVKPSGEIRYIHGFASVSYDAEGKPILIHGINQDVTESYSGQIALRELSAIYSNVPGILFTIKVEPGERFRFASMNPAGLAAMGVREEQVVGRMVEEVIAPESVSLVLEKYREAIRTKSTVRWEERSTYPAGAKFGEVAVTPMVDQGGSVAYLSGAVHDLTERKRLEEALRAAVESRDEFIFIASHELKTPLTALHLQIQLLRRLMTTSDTTAHPEQIDVCNSAMESMNALNRLINDLLDVTRIRAGKLTIHLQDVDLREEVRRVISKTRDYAAASGSSIVFVADDSVNGRWDPTRMRQVVTNLLSNAIKFGAGQAITVRLHFAAGGEAARLEIQDHGIGIAKELQPKVFDRFQQAPTSARGSGLGLGLYIARQIVEAHGGSIQIESEPGKGSLFIVELPLSAEVVSVP
jgi:PAS domain S-box-containing protein